MDELTDWQKLEMAVLELRMAVLDAMKPFMIPILNGLTRFLNWLGWH